jgi:hypothetical protein
MGGIKVKLPGGREALAVWSNISPCGMISERLVAILDIETFPFKKCRKNMCTSVLGGGFGGSKEQWHFVRELEISLEVQRSGVSEVLNLTVGPLLVAQSPVCPLSFGRDFHRAVGGSIGMNSEQWTFDGLGVTARMGPVELTGPDPDNPVQILGSCSWMWNQEVEHEQCAKCGFRFPHLMQCGCCKQITYCSKACQRQDWKGHKLLCEGRKLLCELGIKTGEPISGAGSAL